MALEYKRHLHCLSRCMVSIKTGSIRILRHTLPCDYTGEACLALTPRSYTWASSLSEHNVPIHVNSQEKGKLGQSLRCVLSPAYWENEYDQGFNHPEWDATTIVTHGPAWLPTNSLAKLKPICLLRAWRDVGSMDMDNYATICIRDSQSPLELSAACYFASVIVLEPGCYNWAGLHSCNQGTMRWHLTQLD